MAPKILEHGIIARKTARCFNYYGWGSVTRMGEHTLVAACSGERYAHVCPFGKTELFYSFDDGHTWGPAVVVNNTVLDDRDAGIVSLGGKKLLLTWFSHPLRYFETHMKPGTIPALYVDYCKEVESEEGIPDFGSQLRLSDDGGLTWSPAQKIDVSAPHGPALLKDGTLLYLGKELYTGAPEYDPPLEIRNQRKICAWASADGGKTWQPRGAVPLAKNTQWIHFHEPHCVELPSGRILGMLRFQNGPYPKDFSMFQTYSDDGGYTWTDPVYTDVSGSPPHLLVHSSGAVICSFGRREAPFGERIMISRDEGRTWEPDFEISRGEDLDLGYPCTVELADGSLFTVYYQKFPGDRQASFLYTRWEL